MTTTVRPRRTRTPAATLIGWLSVIAALGTALLAVAHLGVEVPLLSGLGPGGGDAVPQAAIGFGVAALLYTVIAIGAFASAGWTWALALLINAGALATGIMMYRGPASAAGIVVAVLSLILLLSPGGRRAFRRERGGV